MTEDTEEIRQVRRRAIVFLGEQELTALIGLPKGWQIRGVHDDFARFGIRVMIEGPDLPEVIEGSEAPMLPGSWLYSDLTPEGEVVIYRRLDFQPEAPPSSTLPA